MATIEELVVRAKPEGLQNTADQFENVQDELQETEEEMAGATGEFQDLQEKWEGALGAIVAGVAIAVGGLLSQVPILQQTMSGLGAVISSIGFQLDQVLRPALQPVTNGLFNLSAEIASLNGTAGDLAGIIGGIVVAVTGAAGAFLGWVTATQGVTAAASTLAGWLSTIGSGLLSLVGTIASFVTGTLAGAAALGAIIGTFGVAILEVTGFLDMVQRAGAWVRSQLPASVRDGLLAVSSIVLGLLGTIGGAILGFVQGTLDGGLSEGIDRAVSTAQRVLGVFEGAWTRTLDRIDSAVTSLVNDAVSWGENIVDGIIQGITNAANGLAQAIENNVAQPIRDRLPSSPAKTGPLSDLDQVGPGLVNTVAEGINTSTSTVAQAGNNMAGNMGGSGSGVGNPLDSPPVFIDGREITNQTGRYRRDATSQRGRDS